MNIYNHIYNIEGFIQIIQDNFVAPKIVFVFLVFLTRIVQKPAANRASRNHFPATWAQDGHGGMTSPV